MPLAQIARETGALVLRGQPHHPGSEIGLWEIGAKAIYAVLYQLRGCEVLLILAPAKAANGCSYVAAVGLS